MNLLVENVLKYVETEPYILIVGNGPLFGNHPVLMSEEMFYVEYLPRFYHYLRRVCEYKYKIEDRTESVDHVQTLTQMGLDLSCFVRRSVINIWNSDHFCASELTVNGRKVKINHIYREEVLEKILTYLVNDGEEVRKIKDIGRFVGSKAPYIGEYYNTWLDNHFN